VNAPTPRHPLFARQARKLLSGDQVTDALWQAFLEAVNQSYLHYDENRLLVERAMRLASEEISEANQRLREETIRQRYLISAIKKAITEFRPAANLTAEGDLFRIAEILQEAVDERKLIEQELVEAREVALASLRARQTFLANVSHEVRTPIHAISGLADLLLETDLSEGQRNYLNALRSSAEGLTRIINDILDISKVESGRFTLEEIAFPLRDLLQTLVQTLAPKAHEKGIKLHLEIEEGIPEWAFGDPTRVRQILLNIVGNAIKFTESGHVIVRLMLVETNADTVRIAYEVEDTGIGIDSGRLERIFEQFTQEDESVTRRFGGTGLGLSISRTLTELLGGSIEVWSEKGKGSMFRVVLPFRMTDKPMPLNPPSAAMDFSGLHILVVDDNELNRLLAASILSRWNVRTDSARDGSEAWELLKASKYDCILLDIQMPVLDGLELVRMIRNEVSQTLPVLAVSAHASDEERERSLEAGMTDYLPKPFQADELAALLRKWCPGHHADTFHGEGQDTANFSLDKLETMFSGNRGHVDRTVQVFIDQLLAESSRLQSLLTAREYDQISGICHKLEPNLRLFGATTMHEQLIRIRGAARDRASDDLASRIFVFTQSAQALVEALRKRNNAAE